MLQGLALWGLPKDPKLRRALERLPPTAGWPPSLSLVDPRLGPAIDRGQRTIEPSRRLSVLLADLLELQPNLRVALPAQGFRFLRALVKEVGAHPLAAASGLLADRVLIVEPASAMRIRLARKGFALRLDVRAGKEALEKQLPSASGLASMGLLGLRLAAPSSGGGARTIKRLLELEGLQVRALARKSLLRKDRQFWDAVRHTWGPSAGRGGTLTAVEKQRLEDARDFFHLGYIEQFAGDLTEAIGYFRASSELFPTAEAHTFLGWAYHLAGRTDQAIEECRRAILVDPDFGNPYNDIGAYLLGLGKPREALPWLLRAETAKRYSSPHYAHCNAGRAYLLMGRPSEARQEFLRALDIAPGYAPAIDGLRRISPRQQ